MVNDYDDSMYGSVSKIGMQNGVGGPIAGMLTTIYSVIKRFGIWSTNESVIC